MRSLFKSVVLGRYHVTKYPLVCQFLKLLGSAQDVSADGLAHWSVSSCVGALPATILPFSSVAFAVGSSFCHVDRLLSQLSTLSDICDLCPALYSNPDGEKAPRLLVDLHHPWVGSSFTGLFLFSGANYAVALLGDSMVTILISRSTSFRFKTRSIANNHMDHINRYQ